MGMNPHLTIQMCKLRLSPDQTCLSPHGGQISPALLPLWTKIDLFQHNFEVVAPLYTGTVVPFFGAFVYVFWPNGSGNSRNARELGRPAASGRITAHSSTKWNPLLSPPS